MELKFQDFGHLQVVRQIGGCAFEHFEPFVDYAAFAPITCERNPQEPFVSYTVPPLSFSCFSTDLRQSSMLSRKS